MLSRFALLLVKLTVSVVIPPSDSDVGEKLFVKAVVGIAVEAAIAGPALQTVPAQIALAGIVLI
jgi:hypothetical protein